MSELTALEIADRLKEIYYGKIVNESADMLRQQHAEIERLTAIIAKDGYAELWAECYTLRCEIKGPDGFETWKDAAVHERREMVKVKAEAKRLTKERDAAIAAAVAAERDACAAVCIAQADRLEGPSDACGIALVCAGMIRARTKP